MAAAIECNLYRCVEVWKFFQHFNRCALLYFDVLQRTSKHP